MLKIHVLLVCQMFVMRFLYSRVVGGMCAITCELSHPNLLLDCHDSSYYHSIVCCSVLVVYQYALPSTCSVHGRECVRTDSGLYMEPNLISPKFIHELSIHEIVN